MPHVTGFHLARAFQCEAALADCAFVAISGYGDVYGWATMKKDGFRAVLQMFAPTSVSQAA